MNEEAYQAHRKVITELKKQYKDKGIYPKGIHSDNADVLDREEYLDSIHYVAVYHLLMAKTSGNLGKAKRIKRSIRRIEQTLNEHFERIGLPVENHGFEHITEGLDLD